MQDNATHHDLGRGARRTRWWGVPVVAAVMAIGMFTTACSGDNPASPSVANVATPSTTTSASSGGSTRASALAYSQCMRSHGIKDFPDPNSDGEITLNAGPGSDLDFNNPRYKSADNACKSLLPPRQGPPKGLKAANLKYAKCMRAHGISDFPDPEADGSLQIQSQPGSDLDPANPQYKVADNACRQFLPGGGKGGSLTQSGGDKS